MSPPYMNDIFEPVGQPSTTTRAPLLKLNQPLQRTNRGQNNIALIIWNNLPISLKTTDNLNTYKYRVKGVKQKKHKKNHEILPFKPLSQEIQLKNLTNRKIS